MEAVAAHTRHSAALPSIGFLEGDKIKREEAEYQRRNTAAPMASPSFPYTCPPPPYSHPPTTAASSAPGQSALISPPESRRTSGDDAAPILPTRQSLPSISEALGGTNPASYQTQTSAPPTTASSFYQSQPASSFPDPHRASYTQIPPSQQEPRHSYTHAPPLSPSYMRHPSQPMHAPHTPTTGPADVLPRPAQYQQPKLPTLHPLRTASPINSLRPNVAFQQPQQSPSFDPTPNSQPAPPSTPYGYSPFQPQNSTFTFSRPSASASMYSSSSMAPPHTPQYPPPPSWRREDDDRADDRQNFGRPVGLPYVESVKRHLDSFDLEASLNEIAESSGRILDFAREYGVQAHPNQRGQNVQGIPQLHVVDDLMAKSRKIQDSLIRIRDVVMAQNAAMEEQLKDSRSMSNGFGPDMNGYSDDGKGSGGFAGSDTKKRRGRAAPPGRCHSCNRAETPEWRRGPDGARTLCNACGLHYAKLTRKLGNNKAAIGNSNLRPKSMGPGSPPA